MAFTKMKARKARNSSSPSRRSRSYTLWSGVMGLQGTTPTSSSSRILGFTELNARTTSMIIRANQNNLEV